MGGQSNYNTIRIPTLCHKLLNQKNKKDYLLWFRSKETSMFNKLPVLLYMQYFKILFNCCICMNRGGHI